jgi:hypothetical protein
MSIFNPFQKCFLMVFFLLGAVTVHARMKVNCSREVRLFLDLLENNKKSNLYDALTTTLATVKKASFLEFEYSHGVLRKFSRALIEELSKNRASGEKIFKGKASIRRIPLKPGGPSSMLGHENEKTSVVEWALPNNRFLQVLVPDGDWESEIRPSLTQDLLVRVFTGSPLHDFSIMPVVPADIVQYEGQSMLLAGPILSFYRIFQDSGSPRAFQSQFEFLSPLPRSFEDVHQCPQCYGSLFSQVRDDSHEFEALLRAMKSSGIGVEQEMKAFNLALAQLDKNFLRYYLGYLGAIEFPALKTFESIVSLGEGQKLGSNNKFQIRDHVFNLMSETPYRLHLVENGGQRYVLELGNHGRTIYTGVVLSRNGQLKSFKSKMILSNSGQVTIEGENDLEALGSLAFPLYLVQKLANPTH